MELYPAIDLMDGGCVRLSEGDFEARTNYTVPPVEVAQQYEQAGARWLHVVDLDGAKDPAKRQRDVIAAIASGTKMNVQTGGGVRSAQDVQDLLDCGAARVVIGSLCVREPETVKALLQQHGPEKIVLALDVRGDFDKGFFIATAGWRETSSQRIEDILNAYRGFARHILCTDIAKDGLLAGPNVKLYEYLCRAAPDFAFQASGGVSNLSDLKALKGTGVAGAVVGKALYEGRFDLVDALKVVA